MKYVSIKIQSVYNHYDPFSLVFEWMNELAASFRCELVVLKTGIDQLESENKGSRDGSDQLESSSLASNL